MSDIKELTEKIKKFARAREWEQFHNPKDLSISLVLEAAEVLEHFQWKSSEDVIEYVKTHSDEVGEELADVAIYLFELAERSGIDLEEAVEKKLAKNEKRFPVEKAKGNYKKPRELGTEL
jgi:NTP pyrophosphatase (non-canonical NTP hydrolase)